jgi:alpha-tubulin suppressor-like RCC1 family protein
VRKLRLPLLAALALAACETSTSPPEPGGPAALQIVSGDLQTATVGQELPEALVARVTDEDGDPVAGQLVDFRVTAGGGTVHAGAAQTNAQGEVRERWTLGTVAGDTQRVEARAVDAATGEALLFATFRAVATPGPAASITALAPTARTGQAGQPLADSLRARVADAYGNAVPGVPVAWMATAGGGTVAPASGTTDATGTARAQWTLGLHVGAQQAAEASISPAVRAQFTAVAGVPLGATLTAVSGDNQSAPAGSALPAPVVVEVRTAGGQLLPGVPVTWTPAAGSGTATPPVSQTDLDGRASTAWTLGTAAGPQQLTASAEGTAPVTFGATASAGAAAGLAVVGGNGQSAPPSAALPQPLVVRLADVHGNPLAGVTVTWTVTQGTGSPVPTQSVTDAAGEARTRWTLGPERGAQALTATAAGHAAQFTATAVVGPLARVVITPDGVRLTALNEEAQLTAVGTDANGNPVEAPIIWAALDGAVTVNQQGRVRAVAEGQGRVMAAAGAFSDTVVVRVERVGRAVQISGTRTPLTLGDTVRLSAAAQDGGGQSMTIPVRWSSSNPAVLTVNAGGLVRAVGAGTAQITAEVDSAQASVSITVPEVFAVRQIDAGADFTCAITLAGTTYCWGWDETGQLGNGPGGDSSVPVPVSGGIDFAVVRTGERFLSPGALSACGLTAGGTAYCWGNHEAGQLGFDDGRATTPPARCTTPWGSAICQQTPRAVDGGHTFTDIAVGAEHTCAVTPAGEAYCWGRAAEGQLGVPGNTTCTRYLQTSTQTYSCALTPQRVTGVPALTQIRVGAQFTCGLDTNGQAWCWGRNHRGQLGGSGPGPVAVQGGHTFTQIGLGGIFGCGLTSGGAVYCWGDNQYSKLALPSSTAYTSTPVLIGGLPAAEELSLGYDHACVLTTAGLAYCWGSNNSNQSGKASTADNSVGPVADGLVFSSIAAGPSHTCAIRAADQVAYCWGSNYYGQLGTGLNGTYRPRPVRNP